MGVKQKSDRDQVRAGVSAGGWEVAWGDLVNEFDVATGVLSSIIPGGGLAAWVTEQIQAQLRKFGQSLNDISPAIRDQAIQKLQEIVKNGSRGEWNISGLGIKAGVVTYHRWWKIPPFGGWNKLPPNFQPYIGFRITSALLSKRNTADSIEIKVPFSIADIGPIQDPSSPPPSPIGTYEDISLGLSEEDLNSVLAREGQDPLPPAPTLSTHA